MRIVQKLRILLLVLVIGQSGFAQGFFNGNYNRDKKYVLLAHPTVNNLKTILFLSEKGLLEVPNTDFVAVYYRNESYDFQQSIDFVAEEKITNIHFQEISGLLDVTTLFKENGCTDQFQKVFESSIGIILFGGPDILPEIYNENNILSVVTDPYRHMFELSLLFHLLGGNQNPDFVPLLANKPNYVITGFCLGMQSMNVATGGSLYQDIPEQIYQLKTDQEIVKLPKNNLHRNYWQNISNDSLLMGINFHSIKAAKDGFFKNRVGYSLSKKPLVLTAHHQSINKIGKGWIVTAFSMDGKVIEGIRHEKYPHVFAVQFHPEAPALYEDRDKEKFSPTDQPKSYHEIIGENGLLFHQKYWKTISNVFKDALGL